jgi:glycosyltransferase involved in cell wall biosynthesis
MIRALPAFGTEEPIQSTMSPQPVVALVEWNWSGHHPTYFAHFVLSLEELGYRVLAICSRQDEARYELEHLRGSRANSLPAFRQSVFLQVPRTCRSFFPLLRLRRLHQSIFHFIKIDRLVRDWERSSRTAVQLLFYACIYDWDFLDFRFARPFLRIPWSGLYLHARSLRMPGSIVPVLKRPAEPERIFSGRNFKSVAILDEGITRQVAQLVKRPVVVFPDLTDQRLTATEAETGLATKLRAFAGNHRVVGLFGHLHQTKGITIFAKMVSSHRWDDIRFAVAGEITWTDFSEEARAEIEAMLTDNPSVWSHLVRIPDGPRFNGLLGACDILFAAYLNFPHSSNILTKAALLRKPVIVSDGYLMAERVRSFRLGVIIPEGDAKAAAAAIRKLSADPLGWVAQNSPDWTGYLKQHSFETLKIAFSEVLRSIDA